MFIHTDQGFLYCLCRQCPCLQDMDGSVFLIRYAVEYDEKISVDNNTFLLWPSAYSTYKTIRPPSGHFFTCGHNPMFLAGHVKRVIRSASCDPLFSSAFPFVRLIPLLWLPLRKAVATATDGVFSRWLRSTSSAPVYEQKHLSPCNHRLLRRFD